MKYSIPTTGFFQFFSQKGITITELQNLKNIATNMVQQIRKPFQKASIYDTTFKPLNFSVEKTTKGFIPSLDDIDESIQLEGQLNAFNEFATKVMEAHKSIKFQIETTDWRNLVDTSELELLELELVKLKEEKPIAAVCKENQTEMFDYFSQKELYDYLIYNQTASALGNLILANPENSNNPRNFLYQIFEQEYIPFVKKDTLYYPTLEGEELKTYENKFFNVQAQHREFEKKKNHLKVTYQNWLDQENKKLKEEYTYAMNEYKEVYDNWATKVEKLSNDISSLERTLRSFAEETRKKLEIDFFSKKVWLPELARKTVEILKSQQAK